MIFTNWEQWCLFIFLEELYFLEYQKWAKKRVLFLLPFLCKARKKNRTACVSEKKKMIITFNSNMTWLPTHNKYSPLISGQKIFPYTLMYHEWVSTFLYNLKRFNLVNNIFLYLPITRYVESTDNNDILYFVFPRFTVCQYFFQNQKTIKHDIQNQ